MTTSKGVLINRINRIRGELVSLHEEFPQHVNGKAWNFIAAAANYLVMAEREINHPSHPEIFAEEDKP